MKLPTVVYPGLALTSAIRVHPYSSWESPVKDGYFGHQEYLMCQKYSSSHKTLLLGFLIFLRHGTEWVIFQNPAHAAAGRFPKQPGKARHGRTGKSQELLDVGVIPVTKLPAKGKTPGLKILQGLFYSRGVGCLHPATGPWERHLWRGRKANKQ